MASSPVVKMIRKGVGVANDSDPTKTAIVTVDDSATAGKGTVILAKQTDDRQLTLPDQTGTLATKEDIDALTTDDIEEGSSNLYFTEERVRETPLTGYSSTGTTLADTDKTLEAFEKLDAAVKVVSDEVNALDTDDIPEGSTNKYFTEARVLDTTLTGYSSTGTTLADTDKVLEAFEKLDAAIGGGGGGSGDVTGPASSTDNAVVVFDGTTGKKIKELSTLTATKLGSGDVVTASDTGGLVIKTADGSNDSGNILIQTGDTGGDAPGNVYIGTGNIPSESFSYLEPAVVLIPGINNTTFAPGSVVFRGNQVNAYGSYFIKDSEDFSINFFYNFQEMGISNTSQTVTFTNLNLGQTTSVAIVNGNVNSDPVTITFPGLNDGINLVKNSSFTNIVDPGKINVYTFLVGFESLGVRTIYASCVSGMEEDS